MDYEGNIMIGFFQGFQLDLEGTHTVSSLAEVLKHTKPGP